MIDLEYSKKHVHFYTSEVPEILHNTVRDINYKINIVDIGCGDGSLLYALNEKKLLDYAEKIIGVDISPIRVHRFEKAMKNIEASVVGIVSDACNIRGLDDGEFDIILCTQVIEHIPNDNELVKEIYRLLNPKGVAYISSVIKRRYGFYIYRKAGKFRLDPTHFREYSSKDEFIDLLNRNGLNVIEYNIYPIRFPLTDLIIKTLIRFKLIPVDNVHHIYNASWLKFLRKIRIPIIGYFTIEVLCKR